MVNWEAIGAIGEILGAIAVFASLLYLATQIRIQNRESRLSAIRDVGAGFNDFLGDLATNKTLADIFVRGNRDPEELDATERMQYYAFMSRSFRSIEPMHKQYIDGYLEAGSFEGVIEVIKNFNEQPGYIEWWKNRKHWFSKEFQAFVDPLIDKSA